MAVLLLAASPAGCGQGHGTGVRSLGEDASGSGSGSGVGSGSAIAAGCADGSTEGEPPSSDAVTIALTEWYVEPGSAVASGEVILAAANLGAEPHELVVVRAGPVESHFAEGMAREVTIEG